MKNSPVVKLAIVGVSRDCFPIDLTRKRMATLVEACRAVGLGTYACEKIIEQESDVGMVLAMCQDARVNAVVVYLGNFGPEGPISIFAREFDKFFGPVMLCGAAEEPNLIEGRGDALCGMLVAMLNSYKRKVRVHLPRRPIDLPEGLAQEIGHFRNVARVILGLRSLKVVTFGPRPQDFFGCDAPIQQLLEMGIEVMENSELDLLQLFNAISADDGEVVVTAADMAQELGKGNAYPDLLPRLARLEVCLKRFAEANKGNSKFVIFANKCWPGFEKAFEMVPCYVNGRLAAQGVPIACEVDVYGAVSEYICQLAADDVATLLDVNNTCPADRLTLEHPLPLGCLLEDLVMCFHCGNTAQCNLCPGCAMKYQLIMNRLMEPGQEPNITRGTLEGQLKPGPVTMFRLQPKVGINEMRTCLAQGMVLENDPKSFGGIGIVAIPGFSRFYRYVMLAKQFPHHAAFVFAHAGAVIYDAMQLWGIGEINVPKDGRILYDNENPFAA